MIIKEILEKTDTLPALVYRVYLYADYPQNTEVGFIDAHTGSLRMTEPVFIDFSAQGTFATRYSGSQQGTTHNYQGSYHLVDSTRNTIIHTWNLEGRTNILSRVDITDNDNNWTQAEHRPNNNDRLRLQGRPLRRPEELRRHLHLRGRPLLDRRLQPVRTYR